MTDVKISIFLPLLGFAAISVAQATTLTFEDLNPAPASFDVMPAPYAGFMFTGWYFGPDTLYTPASGVTDLFTDYADPSQPDLYVETSANSIASATPFHFDGAAFSGYSGVKYELSLGGNLVHTSSRLSDAPGADPYAPTFLASGYAGLVDSVVVVGVQGYYSMDDFAYHAPTQQVPEPGTVALLLLGLGLVARRARVPAV